jgi:hypothetical protein
MHTRPPPIGAPCTQSLRHGASIGGRSECVLSLEGGQTVADAVAAAAAGALSACRATSAVPPHTRTQSLSLSLSRSLALSFSLALALALSFALALALALSLLLCSLSLSLSALCGPDCGRGRGWVRVRTTVVAALAPATPPPDGDGWVLVRGTEVLVPPVSGALTSVDAFPSGEPQKVQIDWDFPMPHLTCARHADRELEDGTTRAGAHDRGVWAAAGDDPLPAQGALTWPMTPLDRPASHPPCPARGIGCPHGNADV